MWRPFCTHKAQSVKGCCSLNPSVCLLDMDSVQQECQELNWFHLNCLCRLLHICWWHRLPDTEVLNHAELSSIHTYLCKAQVHWAGHVLRMDDEHLAKCLLFGGLIEGKRSIGGQKKCFKDNLKASLKDFSIDPDVKVQNEMAWVS